MEIPLCLAVALVVPVRADEIPESWKRLNKERAAKGEADAVPGTLGVEIVSVEQSEPKSFLGKPPSPPRKEMRFVVGDAGVPYGFDLIEEWRDGEALVLKQSTRSSTVYLLRGKPKVRWEREGRRQRMVVESVVKVGGLHKYKTRSGATNEVRVLEVVDEKVVEAWLAELQKLYH
jgi:hypothetical protein